MSTYTAIGKIPLPNVTLADIAILQFVLESTRSMGISKNVELATILFKNLNPEHLATQDQNVITIWGQKIWIGDGGVHEKDKNSYVLKIGGGVVVQNQTAFFVVNYLNSYLPLRNKLFIIEGISGIGVDGYNFLSHILKFAGFAK